MKVNPENEEEMLKEYKNIIEEQFFPSKGDSVLNYNILREVISNFEKLSTKPENVAELMLTYVENGVEFTNTYGDIDGTFYNNIAGMYNKTVQYILEKNLEDKYQERCQDELEGEEIPKVGDLSIVIDWEGVPRCVIETREVIVIPFSDITFDICKREGEDDTLESWRAGHTRFFREEGNEIGYEFSVDMPVIFEDFEVVYQV